MTQLHTDLTILALDTCTESCSAALLHDNKQYNRVFDAPREHSQRILPMVDEVLTEAGIKISNVNLIAYGRGPGSFTGIRICTSMTQGLALGHDIPVIGVSTLAAMAQMAIETEQAEQIFCAIDARMSEIYWGQFINVDGIATLVGAEHVSSPDSVDVILDKQKPMHICGTGFVAYPDLLNDVAKKQATQITLPDASAMIKLVIKAHEQGLATSVDELAPVYLRDKVTWKKLPGRE
ncbi:tRNA (adenosine(37)-N6)-threonylcarbamoyltransferase complex dimerization subunit type 1 TsaB [Shewanella sp. 6_MG-2023]|uniref:tRNA (adenosine(37)-N6)-threonylcarbamoyltransferase complex dimerization subunit type 1 TsaB n=1 Tax=Shewanella sp. 6_MG-2023 TaxID=3062660 RepID=UPI0026E374A4|nr:tRNA (adenosine(37)-N6)-threonylcarbamoyltransferase complex dimerization subunit type 1 TsaB [Shewanella sp. 6_MG-2023]MDO6619307.1 tRNA (adenosine(37)-N6)-threonylcarbamoyltransferase complex dimerization subunit type 1 TsaB [Shewanella sp. 6_MG-2023]